MKPLAQYLPVCNRASVDAFVRQLPGPFLVHSSRTGGRLEPSSDGGTMDALVLGGEAAGDASSDRISVFTVVQPVPEGAPHVIGSGSGCALRVPAASVSRVHALLRKEGHRWFLEDAGSSAGTWVNGVALEHGTRKALAPGDRLSLGSLDFTFLPSEDFHAYARARSRTYAVS